MNIFVLASGNKSIGKGHINRSLSIVRKLKTVGADCRYFCFDNDESVNLEIEKDATCVGLSTNEKVINNPDTYIEYIKSVTNENAPSLLYVDSDYLPFYSVTFQKEIVNAGVKLMYATLFDQFHFYAHIILNQNIIALSQNYTSEEYTKKLLGPKYMLWANEEVKSEEELKRVDNAGQRLFINFGNADPNNLSSKIWEVIKLTRSHFSRIIVVVGDLYPGFDELQKSIEEFSDPQIELHQSVRNMGGLMKVSDLAISSLGMTFWELTYLNIPSIIIAGSERELAVCNHISDKNYAFKLGSFNDENWLSKWTDSLESFMVKEGSGNLKTAELKKLINVNGLDLVVEEIIQTLASE